MNRQAVLYKEVGTSYKRYTNAINSLAIFPGRCPLAPESSAFPLEIRQLLYGRSRNAYRILFTITEDTVSVLHIRHSAQDTLKLDTDME